MTSKQKDLTKNFFALGLMFWLYERSMDPTIHWIDSKFGARPIVADANKRALKAGYAFGETTEAFHTHYRVKPAKLDPGVYRNITGNEATALGFLTASRLADRQLFYGSYPITPRRRTSSTSCRATRRSGSRPSRQRMRSLPSGLPSGRRTVGRSR